MIEFESVGKTFRDGTAAVVDLSLTVPTGKITVIVGPSGCGKTTTLRMVNRMLEPTSGRILWDGSALRSKRKTTLRRQMGYVIQSGGLFPHRTVIENIGTVPRLLGWSKDKTQKRSSELLASVGLDRKLATRYPAQLSGGQQQRVGVARALAADPLVLLMDEPFSAVDPVVRSELHEFFLGLQREISKTIILITHDIDEAIKLGDQVAILRVGGRLAQVGTPQQLLEEPADAFVEGFIGKDRGFRSLSFLAADGLRLGRVDVVREVEAVRSDEPTLIVDGDARPLGWAHRDQPGRVVPLGSTFAPESDNLRTALDSALTSPYGLAVAVAPGSGRFAGVVSAGEILAQIADARSTAAESIALSRDSAAGLDAPVDGQDADLRPAPAEGQDEEASTGSTAIDGDPVEGSPDDDLRPEPVGGPDGGAATGSANVDGDPVDGSRHGDLRSESAEGPDDEAAVGTPRMGSSRLDELQLSAEPVETSATRPEPIDEPENGDPGSVRRTEEPEPDRDHVR